MLHAPLTHFDARLTLAHIIEADFAEMPGMRLTRPQAQRLYNLSPEECEGVLADLVRAGRLVRDPAGQYCVPDCCR